MHEPPPSPCRKCVPDGQWQGPRAVPSSRGQIPLPIPTVVFVGALTPGKRPDCFIGLVANLRSRGIKLRARVIGTGPMHDALVGPARQSDVELMGPRSDVPALLRQSDLLVFPSLPAGEGMPGVLIEAGLSGLPVVTTAVPGVGSIVADGETGIVVAVNDLSGLTDAAARLLHDVPAAASHGCRATGALRRPIQPVGGGGSVVGDSGSAAGSSGGAGPALARTG